MSIQTESISGCCAGQLYYDLGTAHDVDTAYSQEIFDEWMIKAGHPYKVNVCIINSEQTREHRYLKKQGWKFKKVDDLRVGTVDGRTLTKYFLSVKRKKLLDSDLLKKKSFNEEEINILFDLFHERESETVKALIRINHEEVKKFSEFLREKIGFNGDLTARYPVGRGAFMWFHLIVADINNDRNSG